MGRKSRQKRRRGAGAGRAQGRAGLPPSAEGVGGGGLRGPSRDRRVLVGLVLVAALGCGLYARSADFEFTHTDDKVLIVDQAHFVQQIGNVWRTFSRPFFPRSGRGDSYYRPLITISLMLDAQWTGLAPKAYHVTNTLVHGLASALLLLLLLRMGFARAVAVGGAAVFAVHPVLTEAVAWIPGRCDTVLAVFAFSAMLLFFRYLEGGGTRWLIGHCILLLAALMTKEAAVVIPATLIAWVLLVDGRRALLRTPALWAGWAVAGLIWLLAWLAVNPTSGESLGTRLTALLQNLPVLLMHLGKIALPYDLTVLAIARDTTWVPGALALVPLALAAWWLRGRERRLLLWGLSWFLLFLLPTLPVSDFLILENRLYLPTIGILVGLLAVVAQLLARYPVRATRAALAVGAVALVTTFSLLSWRYSEAFRDADAFTADAVRGSPSSALAQLNRGIVYHRRNRFEEAERHYGIALKLDPRQPVLHNNIGLIRLRRDDLQRAEKEFRTELANNPAYAKAHFNLGLVLRRKGQFEPAAESFRQALRHSPNDVQALQELYGYHRFVDEPAEAQRYAERLRALGQEPMMPGPPPGSGRQLPPGIQLGREPRKMPPGFKLPSPAPRGRAEQRSSAPVLLP